jgi:hypothetical protein
MAVLDSEEGVAKSLGKWVVCWGAADDITGLLVGPVWEVVGGKSRGFKDGRCVGCVEGTGECVICSEFAKRKIFS